MQDCNLSCEYCFYQDKGREKGYMSLELFKKSINPDVDNIYLSGGEPFLNPDILEIIRAIKYNGKKCTIFSNGIGLFRFGEVEREEILSNIDKIIISFDTFDENYRLRGDNTQNIEKIIKEILRFSPNILEVKICVNKYNVEKFEETILGLSDLGVKTLSVNIVHDISSNEKKFRVEPEQIIKVYQIIDKYGEMFSSSLIDAQKKFINKEYNSLFTSCKAGYEFYFVNFKGEKEICPVPNKNKGISTINCFSEVCVNLWEVF